MSVKISDVLLFVLLVLGGALHAALEVEPIYQSNMVLQQGRAVPVCGTCSGAGEVTVSFGDQKVAAKVKGKKWQAVLAPMKPSAEGRTLTISQGKETIELANVLVGEVWLASGQSNMLFRLDETPDKAAQTHPEIPELRYYHSEPQVHTGNKPYSPEQLKLLKDKEMYKGDWAVSGGAGSTTRMSAVGWYFGRRLQQALGVPVGIIHVSLGGSEMMAWMPPAVLRKKYKDCLTARWLESKYISDWVRGRGRKNIGADLSAPHPFKPGYLYETGVAPWVKFPISGVIWYQGESDAEIQDSKQNTRLLTDLIKGWRKEFNAPELPFLMVQLPRINDKAPIRAYWPEFREVQHSVAQALPKVYYTVTIDLGSTNSDVHPPRKLEVGERLADLAAARVYGKDVPYTGPVVCSAKLSGQQVVLHFEHAEGLKTTDNAAPVGFEISADGKRYYAATAELQGETVLLSSSEVKKPRFVRYAWATYLAPNLINAHKLPAVPRGELSVDN